jgi:hypothetical protein
MHQLFFIADFVMMVVFPSPGLLVSQFLRHLIGKISKNGCWKSEPANIRLVIRDERDDRKIITEFFDSRTLFRGFG